MTTSKRRRARRPKAIKFATLTEWHAWFFENWKPNPAVLRVLISDFERETKKKCPERLREETTA